MDIRLLLVFILPALATAGTYSDESVSFGMDNEEREFGSLGSYKGDGDLNGFPASVGADILNDGGHFAESVADEYSMKAKAVEQSAKWFQNLLNEKQLIFAQLKKRLNLLRAMAAESLQSAEQYRQSAAEKSQSSKALEAKAREAQSLSKDYAVQVNELRAKMNSELKQHLDALLSSRVAEANADADIAEADMQRTWGAFLEKQAQEMISEAAKWERRAADTLDAAKKLKLEASAEIAKAKDLEKKRKETLDAANEAEKKAHGFYFFHLEFLLKSLADEQHGALARIKAKYLQMLAASLSDSGTHMGMFANMQNKDQILWEKKTANVKSEAKLLEASANKMLQNVEKLKASLKVSSTMAQKRDELGAQEERIVKDQPKAVVPDKKV